MFTGHFGLAFGAKRLSPGVSLGTLFLACQLADLLWPVLVLTGVERVEVAPGNTAFTPLDFVSYPYSHSLAALVLWGLLAGGIHAAIKRTGIVAPIVLAGVVVSHWVLDVVTHRPDMPLTIGGSARLGLGLWNSIPATLVVENLLFLGGVAVYARATRPRDRVGSVALWALVGTLLAISIAALVGPPPPGPGAVAWTAQAMWLLVIWAYWVDRHREPRALGA